MVFCANKWRDSNGNLMAPYLNGNESNRNLNLINVDGDWNSNWRFAARKYLLEDISAIRQASY